jgi:hypothetical protein
MDIKKLKEIIKELQKDLGKALLSTDIWGVADGQSIAGHRSNPTAAALMNRVGKELMDSTKVAEFPSVEKYYVLELKNGKMLLCLLFGDYQWGMLLDVEKIQLGLLLNVIVPKCIEGFNAALTG